MKIWFDHLMLVWLVVLVIALGVHALRAKDTLSRAAALVALGPLVISLLGILAARFGSADYLDIALVIAMLGVAETLTIAGTRRARGSSEHDR